MQFKSIILMSVLAAAPASLFADGSGTSGLVQPAPGTQTTSQDHLRGYRWFRRATLAASCVAGTAIDTWALHRLASNTNVQLSGPFINNGKPQYGELIGIFAGSCALSTFMQERHVFARRETRGLDLTYSIENLGSLGFSLYETEHFLSLANQTATPAMRIQPGTIVVTH